MEFVDIAGLVKGASKGEGLGNQFLSHIREVDAVAHVVRCFDDTSIVHVETTVDPGRDIGVIETELIFKDLETIERRLVDAYRRGRAGDDRSQAEASFIERLRDHLFSGRLARYLNPGTDDERIWKRDMHLLTDKPVLYVCNVGEKNPGGDHPYVRAVRETAARDGAGVVVISASIEAELASLDAEERGMFLDGLGLTGSGLERLIREAYDLLHQITFFTAGPKEVRAWTVRRGAAAPEAAGVVHSDFQRGFIRAEVMKFDDLARFGTEQALRECGLLSIEGKEYRIQDGDIIHFRFNV
jgi:GTP-binding protein YchF